MTIRRRRPVHSRRDPSGERRIHPRGPVAIEPHRETRSLSIYGLASIALILVAFIQEGCSRPSARRGSLRDFTDMAARTVSIPPVVRKIYSTSPMGTTLCYTFDAERVMGWNYAIGEVDAGFIPERYLRLPVLGGWFGKTAGANVELLLRDRPDVILNVALSQDRFTLDSAERLSAKTGIPMVVLTESSIEDIPRLYEQMGDLTGEQARAAELSTLARRIIERARAIARPIAPAERVRVYYAEGLKGLNTEPAGSMHTQVIELCGGHNVAQIREESSSGYGNTPVSLEQVVAWNPDVILISDYLGRDGGRGGWREILSRNLLWKKVRAVQLGRVFIVPRSPFQWIDRPPSVNRLAGILWLPCVLYPERCDYDPKAELRDLYNVLYGVDLDENTANGLLDTAVRL